ncbi:MAG TPA: heme-binding protein, partial [Planctomycetota bacterium]|nr:heme-binding protein [Planctomycetota bacterium]
FFFAIPPEGAITIGGILLPYVKQTTRPAGFGPGPLPVVGTVVTAGRVDPFDYLIGPRAGVDGGPTQVLTLADVTTIIDQVIASANLTRAQVRLPLGSGAKVIATVVDTRGLILAHFRMVDTLCDAVDVVPAKARSVVYFCRPGGPLSAVISRTLANGTVLNFPDGDRWPGFPTGDPRGIALTTRTLGFLSQPFYPPGIDENGPGPLFNLARLNQEPVQVDRWGNAPPDPGYQNGLTFFPGSVPLYKNGELVGALGVSGDGVEQNDLIAFEGGAGFEPPPELRIDNFTFQGVRLPYLKFPQTPR